MAAPLSASQNAHYLKYSSNDYELVIRATKDIEHLLESNFGALGTGLHEKITHTQSLVGLSVDSVDKLRYLVNVRNQLVHKYDFNELTDREQFISSFHSVEKELKGKLEDNDNEDTNCVIS